MKRIFYWLPRILSLLFVGFLSLFALDVFNEHQEWALVTALLIHLIPALVLLVGTIIAWRYSLFGVGIFIVFALWYLFEAGFGRPWAWYALIMGPALVVAVLYLVDWWVQKQSPE